MRLSPTVQVLIDQNRDLFETKTENLTAYQMNFLKAVADGVGSGFSTSKVLQDYRLGSSSNVAIIKKALMEKDLIVMENGAIKLTDPVLGLWLKTV